jgi:hypothetical protein
MARMRRTAALALALLLAGCGGAELAERGPPPVAASPQRAALTWVERYPSTGRERLVFRVESIAVTRAGWTARIAVDNETSVPYAPGRGAAERRYGVMLFSTGDLGELEEAARAGGLPAVREATRIEPEPPEALAPGSSWRASLSAPGSLPAGSHVRVVFGPFHALGEPPEGLEPDVVWITDRSYRLRP